MPISEVVFVALRCPYPFSPVKTERGDILYYISPHLLKLNLLRLIMMSSVNQNKTTEPVVVKNSKDPAKSNSYHTNRYL